MKTNENLSGDCSSLRLYACAFFITARTIATRPTRPRHAVAADTYQIWPAISRMTSGHKCTVKARFRIRLSPERRPKYSTSRTIEFMLLVMT